MNKKTVIEVKGIKITVSKIQQDDFICITDIAKYKNPDSPADSIKNWLRNKNTIDLLGLWEKLNNPEFNLVEFDQFRQEAGYNQFYLPQNGYQQQMQSDYSQNLGDMVALMPISTSH